MFFNVIAGSIVALSSTFVSSAGVQFAGVNIAGFDFGCVTDGHCTLTSVSPPLGGSHADGPSQMTHFTQVDKFNIFRLPVAWQYLQDTPGAPLNTGSLGTYDQLVQACLKTGAHCIVDIHNYARWDGNIIGQSGGPTNDQFADLWSQLAKKYAGEKKIVMGLMNEPHDLPDIGAWATTVQAAVTAIRKAGATDQMILLPGTSYTSAGAFVSDGSAAALNGVKDSDGTTSKLIFDVHNYFDSDGSGTTADCTSNKISDGFQPLVSFLKTNNRQALVSELGGGSSASSCLSNICEALDFLNDNSDVYLGWVGWAAGSFDQSYVLSLRPTDAGQDVELVTQCFAGKFHGGGGSLNGTIAGGTSSTPASGTSSTPTSGASSIPTSGTSSTPTSGTSSTPTSGTSSTTTNKASNPVQGGGGSTTTGSSGVPKAPTTATVGPTATGTTAQSPVPVSPGTSSPQPQSTGTQQQQGTSKGKGSGKAPCKAHHKGSESTRRPRKKINRKTRKMAAAAAATATTTNKGCSR